MKKVYNLSKIVDCKECGFCEDFDYCQHDANCEVTFHEEFTNDGQHFLHLEFHFNSIWSNEINFKELENLVRYAGLCEEELNIIRKTLKGNWRVKLSNDIFFSCHHEIEYGSYWRRDSSNSFDLGMIGECYDDCSLCNYCEECVRINGRDELLKALRSEQDES